MASLRAGESAPAIQIEAPSLSPDKKRAPKILVINALAAQFESIKRSFPDFDLRLVQDREPGEGEADLIVGMVKFMNHPLDKTLKRKFGDAYCRVNGAADSVKAAIRLKFPAALQH